MDQPETQIYSLKRKQTNLWSLEASKYLAHIHQVVKSRTLERCYSLSAEEIHLNLLNVMFNLLFFNQVHTQIQCVVRLPLK